MAEPSGEWDFDDCDPEVLRRRGSIKWSLYEPDVLACWVAEMDFAVAPCVRDAVLDSVRREQFGYPVPDEMSGLPGAVAAFQLSRYGCTVEPTMVHVLPDVMKGVELAIRLYSPEASPIILPTPAYMPFFELPKVTRRRLVEVPSRSTDGVYRLDTDAIEDALRDGGGTLVLCNPYNPVGRSLSRDELAEVCAVVDRHRGRVVADEIHAPLTYPGPDVSVGDEARRAHVPYASISEVAASHAVTVTSASKGWNLPGLKTAQMIISNPVDEELWRSLSILDTHGASTLGIVANLAAYRDGVPWLDSVVDYLDASRRHLSELLDEHLPGVIFRPPEAGYLAWLDCRPLELGDEPADFFLTNARVATNHGNAFGAPGTGHVRFNFGTSRSIVERAVRAMGDAVRRR